MNLEITYYSNHISEFKGHHLQKFAIYRFTDFIFNLRSRTVRYAKKDHKCLRTQHTNEADMDLSEKIAS